RSGSGAQVLLVNPVIPHKFSHPSAENVRVLPGALLAAELIAGTPPVHPRLNEGSIDPIPIFQSNIQERVKQRMRKKMGLQTEIEKLGMLRIVVMFLRLHPRIRQMIDLDRYAQFFPRR